MIAARQLDALLLFQGILALEKVEANGIVVWFCNGDWRRGLYWLGAALLTFTVTW